MMQAVLDFKVYDRSYYESFGLLGAASGITRADLSGATSGIGRDLSGEISGATSVTGFGCLCGETSGATSVTVSGAGALLSGAIS